MRLRDLQRELAASLAAAGGTSPTGLDPEALGRARRSLEAKRRQAARHLLPRLAAALGAAWAGRFAEHARRYAPEGLLHHVDDAWELAAAVLASGPPELAATARDDLLALRLRWVRRRAAGAGRIRERRGPLVALTRTGPRRLVLRLPGAGGRVLTLRLAPGGIGPLPPGRA